MEIFESQKVIFFSFSGTEIVSNNFVRTHGSSCSEKYCIASSRFYQRVWNIFCHIKSAPSNLSKYKVSAKTKKPYLSTFSLKFKKAIVVLQINGLKFFKTKMFLLNKKSLYLGPKGLIWVFLRHNFEKLKSAPSNFSKCKVLWKNKNP